jgi:hypothetical protein
MKKYVISSPDSSGEEILLLFHLFGYTDFSLRFALFEMTCLFHVITHSHNPDQSKTKLKMAGKKQI